MSADAVRFLLFSGWTESEVRRAIALNGWEPATVEAGIADFNRRAAEGAYR